MSTEFSPTLPLNDIAPLPSWMVPAVTARQLRLENEHTTFAALFERALDGIASGKPLSQVVEEYPVPVDYARMLAWIHKDENRRSRYYEAQAVGAEVVADQMIAISDAADTVEDVQRSTLRINTRKWLLGVWNRKRYGDVKQIDQTVTIDMGEAMAAAQARVDAARTIDTTSRIIHEHR